MRHGPDRMKWFRHDSNAHRDAKLKRLRIRYGMEGYGLYWHCLELVAETIEPGRVSFELEDDAEVIAHDTGLHYEQVQEMMTYMVDLGLFENNGGIITCLKLAKRLDQSMTSNPQMRALIKQIRKNHDSVMIGSEKVSPDKIRLDKSRVDKSSTVDNSTSIKTTVVNNRGARKRAPKDYQPDTDLLQSLAKETGLCNEALLSHLREMKDHEFRSAKKDWNAVFRNWVRRAVKWEKQTPPRKLSYAEQLQADMQKRGMG